MDGERSCLWKPDGLPLALRSDSLALSRAVIRWVGARCGSQFKAGYCLAPSRIGLYRTARALSCATR